MDDRVYSLAQLGSDVVVKSEGRAHGDIMMRIQRGVKMPIDGTGSAGTACAGGVAMPNKNRSKDSKDSAAKRTLNPPVGGRNQAAGAARNPATISFGSGANTYPGE